MKLLIAIDDTDNKQSRGTGFLARTLAVRLENAGLAKISGITRHQLFVHEDIPFTSHNSAACIASEGNEIGKINYLCRSLIRSESATGSDPGLCIAGEDLVDEDVIGWGRRAKKEVLALPEAQKLAAQKGISLEGLGGTNGGMIGALAAVGLHKTGNDGRFLWVKGMRKYMGVMCINEIFAETGVEEIKYGEETLKEMDSRVLMPEWWRPVLMDRKRILLVEKSESDLYEYNVIPKDHLKRISS